MFAKAMRRLFGAGPAGVSACARSGGEGKARSQRGVMLVEAIVALAITATAGTASLGLISVTSLSHNQARSETTASWIATSQAEHIQAAPYVTTGGQYPAISTPSGFAVTNTTAEVVGGDAAIQLVEISVTRDGGEVMSIELVKVNR